MIEYFRTPLDVACAVLDLTCPAGREAVRAYMAQGSRTEQVLQNAPRDKVVKSLIKDCQREVKACRLVLRWIDEGGPLEQPKELQSELRSVLAEHYLGTYAASQVC